MCRERVGRVIVCGYEFEDEFEAEAGEQGEGFRKSGPEGGEGRTG